MIAARQQARRTRVILPSRNNEKLPAATASLLWRSVYLETALQPVGYRAYAYAQFAGEEMLAWICDAVDLDLETGPRLVQIVEFIGRQSQRRPIMYLILIDSRAVAQPIVDCPLCLL